MGDEQEVSFGIESYVIIGFRNYRCIILAVQVPCLLVEERLFRNRVDGLFKIRVRISLLRCRIVLDEIINGLIIVFRKSEVRKFFVDIGVIVSIHTE